MAKDDRLNVMSISGLAKPYIGFSYKKMPFADVRFRKAACHSVPFDITIKGIWRGVGERAYSWIHSLAGPEGTPTIGDWFRSVRYKTHQNRGQTTVFFYLLAHFAGMK